MTPAAPFLLEIAISPFFAVNAAGDAPKLIYHYTLSLINHNCTLLDFISYPPFLPAMVIRKNQDTYGIEIVDTTTQEYLEAQEIKSLWLDAEHEHIIGGY